MHSHGHAAALVGRGVAFAIPQKEQKQRVRYCSGGGSGGPPTSMSSTPPLREFRREDIVSSSFDSGSFDVVIANDVLGLLPASETLLVLSKIKEWVSKHGRVFLTAPLISEKEETTGGDIAAGSSTGARSSGSNGNFMVGLERSHPEIQGLFFRMFRRNELARMASAVGLRVCRVDIAEPKGNPDVTQSSDRLPPRYALGKVSAWGQQLQETQQKRSAASAQEGFVRRKSTIPSYRCITLILEKES